MSEGTLYLHLGLSKTGSTFFQQEMLPRISGISCLHKPMSDLVQHGLLWDGILSRFFGASPAIWDELGESLFTELLGPPGRPESRPGVLISDEGVLVSWSRDPYSVSQHLEKVKRIASRWHFVRIRVLFTFRRQDTWLASSYTQRSDRFRGASQAHFEDRTRAWLDMKNGYFESGVRLDYALLRRLLVEVLGGSNVLMLPYELMRENPDGFYQRWFAYMGIRDEGEGILRQVCAGNSTHNQRHTDARTWALRPPARRGAPAVRLRPGRAFAALGLPGKIYWQWPDLKRERTIRLTPSLSREIMARYTHSNKSLGRALGMDLSSYGYY